MESSRKVKKLFFGINERLQIQWLRDRAVIPNNDYQMLYVTKPVFSSYKCGLHGIILCEFFTVVKS